MRRNWPERWVRLIAVILTAGVIGSGVAMGPWAATAAQADQSDPVLSELFDRLKAVTDPDEAAVIEDAIWQVWLNRGEALVDQAMARGIQALDRGAFDVSLRYFDDVLALAPDHAEAWNKRATVHYLKGDYAASVADIERTLDLEPRHFGALSGLGLIYSDLGQDEAALKALERALSLNPHLEGVKDRADALRARLRGKPI